MPERHINILFTSVGRRVELLKAFRHAYKSLGLEGNIVAADIDPLAPALQISDRPYIVPRVNLPDYVPTLVEICRQEEANLVFPLIDPDIPALARSRKELETTGARVAVVSNESSAITTDKWLTSEFFNRLGLNAPQSWLQGDFDATRARFPLFVKPRQGSASEGTFKVSNGNELEFFLNYLGDCIIQEYLSGPEITNDIICDLEGKVLAVVSRQRIEVRWGEVAKGVTIYNPNITEACVKIAQELPAVGPITVQCMMKDGVPYFTEINARLGGGAPLAIAAGVDFPKWLLARAASLEVEIPPLGTYEVGLYLTRFDDSFFVTENERDQMASNRV